jgi:hypothetical protein
MPHFEHRRARQRLQGPPGREARVEGIGKAADPQCSTSTCQPVDGNTRTRALSCSASPRRRRLGLALDPGPSLATAWRHTRQRAQSRAS